MVLESNILNKDSIFYRVIRKLLYVFFKNKVIGVRSVHSFLRKCHIRYDKSNIVKIGRNGVINNLNISIDGNDNTIVIDDDFLVNEGLKIEIKGNNNNVTLGKNIHFYEGISKIVIYGNRCEIKMGDDGAFKSCSFVCRDDYSLIEMGNSADIASNVSIISMEGKKVTVGNNLFCSYNVEIRNSDSHSIFEMTGERINVAKDVLIGSNVWIAQGVLILKGSYIANGCIVGAKSMVTKRFVEEKALIFGTPATVKRNNILWDKNSFKKAANNL